MKKKIEHTITKEEVKKFAALSGDFNPIHTHDGVVHGMFLGALVSRLIGMELPGPGALMIKESLEFKKPARVGDTVTITGVIVHRSEAAQLIEIAIEITRNREILAVGSAHVKL